MKKAFGFFKKTTQRLFSFLARTILSLVYFIVIAPVWLWCRMRRDYLGIKGKTGWLEPGNANYLDDGFLKCQ